ncbi:MAG: hypothetical protein ACKVOK_09560 [Flavobacteriales bacterium]
MPRFVLLLFVFVLAFSGCRLPTVEYFRTVPTVAVQQPRQKPGMTLVLDRSIHDTLIIGPPHFKKMRVYSFRQSLAEGLSNAFKCYYDEVKISDEISATGMCLEVVDVSPTFNVKSTRLSRVPNSRLTIAEVEAKIPYVVIIYANGAEERRLSGIAFSALSTFDSDETDMVFKNGIKIMFEEIYRRTTMRY